jgi:hypothetical protein
MWSPDGQRVAFLTGRDRLALVVKALGASGETKIADVSGVGFYPDPARSLS